MKAKKIVAALLALCLLLSVVPMAAFADEVEAEVIKAGDIKTYDLPVEENEGRKTFSFTAEKAGTYVFIYHLKNYGYDNESDRTIFAYDGHGYSLGTGYGRFQWDAEKGDKVRFEVSMTGSGWDYAEVKLLEGVALEAIEIELYENTYFYEGSNIYQNFDLMFQPKHAIVKDLKLSSSNDKAVTFSEGYTDSFLICGAGTADITASANGVSATKKVTIKAPENIKLDETKSFNVTAEEEDNRMRYYFTAPADGTYVVYGENGSYDVDTSTGSSVYSSKRAQFELKKGDVATITASGYNYDMGVKNVQLTVKKAVALEGLTMSQDYASGYSEDSWGAYIQAWPVPMYADMGEVTWTTSNDKVATVDPYKNNCDIAYVAAGTATVTATVGKVSAKCDVVVRETLPLELDKATSFKPDVEHEIYDQRYAFTAPADGTYVIYGAAYFDIQLDNGYAYGNDRAQFDAKSGEKIYITAHCYHEDEEFEIQVSKAVALKSAGWFEEETFVGLGGSWGIPLVIDPINAKIGEVTFKSGDESILVVEYSEQAMCIVEGLKEGTTTLTATVDGKDYVCKVTVGVWNPFDDVDPNKFYFEPVLWAVDMGITTGYKDDTFRPNKTCTRAEVVTFLWRAAGWNAPQSSNNPFPDVADDKYYFDSVLWAVEKGITSGYKDGTFGPSKTCTRAEVVTFLWRFAGKPAPTKTDNPFTDVSNDKYYYDAVLWAVENGITLGKTATTFEPSATCTRGQIVTFLYRYMMGQ